MTFVKMVEMVGNLIDVELTAAAEVFATDADSS